MAPSLDTPVRQLSLGQRMRAEIAAALLHSPELLILDEPTIGLDVLSKQRLREFLRHERASRGTTLLLTTHDMGDIERLCDRVLVVDRGMLAYDGTLPGLAATVGARRVLVVDLVAPTPDLTGIGGAEHLSSEGGGPAPAAGLRRPGHDGGDAARRGLRPCRGARPVDRGARHRGRRHPDLPVPALSPRPRGGAGRAQRVRSIRVLPRVLGLTRSRSRNSATPSSYDRSSSA